MKEVKLNSKTDKGFITVAEIVPPLDRQWYILSPSSNNGWISILLSDRQTVATSLRPGSVYVIAADYQGKIHASLDCLGLPPTVSASIIFVDNYEYEQAYNEHIIIEPVSNDVFTPDSI